MVVWSTTSRALWHLNDDGRECSRHDPTYQRHITFACKGCYQLHHHHRLRQYYPRLIAGTNLPTSKGWKAWLAKAECTHIAFTQDYYTIESKDTGRKWTQVYRVQDQLSANEPTEPYILMVKVQGQAHFQRDYLVNGDRLIKHYYWHETGRVVFFRFADFIWPWPILKVRYKFYNKLFMIYLSICNRMAQTTRMSSADCLDCNGVNCCLKQLELLLSVRHSAKISEKNA